MAEGTRGGESLLFLTDEQVRKGIEAAKPLDSLFEGFAAQTHSFDPLRRRYALYP